MALLSLEELIKMQGKLHKSLLCQCVLHLKQYHGAAVYPQPLMLHPVNSKHGSKGKQTNVGHPIVWAGESAFQPVKQLLKEYKVFRDGTSNSSIIFCLWRGWS